MSNMEGNNPSNPPPQQRAIQGIQIGHGGVQKNYWRDRKTRWLIVISCLITVSAVTLAAYLLIPSGIRAVSVDSTPDKSINSTSHGTVPAVTTIDPNADRIVAENAVTNTSDIPSNFAPITPPESGNSPAPGATNLGFASDDMSNCTRIDPKGVSISPDAWAFSSEFAREAPQSDAYQYTYNFKSAVGFWGSNADLSRIFDAAFNGNSFLRCIKPLLVPANGQLDHVVQLPLPALGDKIFGLQVEYRYLEADGTDQQLFGDRVWCLSGRAGIVIDFEGHRDIPNDLIIQITKTIVDRLKSSR